MTRRDRTTGLPVARRGLRTASRAGGGAGQIAGRTGQIAIIGVAVALLVAVTAFFVYGWYGENVRQPRKVVLSVGPEEFTLSYYAARLPSFIGTNEFAGGLLAVQALLQQLETEGLTAIVAAEHSIALSDEDVTRAIAASLDVPADTTRGSAFDRSYRAELNRLGMSDAHYRRQAASLETARLLRAALREETGERGGLVLIRVVTVATLEEAEAVRARIAAGEDMGSIAQVESAHDRSRQEDGLLLTPPALLAEPLRDALADVEEGTLAGPVEAGDAFWVVRLERRETEGTYTKDHLDGLEALRLEEALADARSRVTIERDFTTSDTSWAFEQGG